MDKLAGIFERFRQAEDSITRQYGGTGLGLSIAKDLILLQNGEIDVESTPEKGTAFNFIIPYEIASPEPDSPKLPEIAGSAYPDWRGAHILVVDDNEMNQTLLRHLLGGWELSFDMVNNGLEAVEKLKMHKYALVLMDIQMPMMDGYTAAGEIRSKLKLDTPIIAMTAHAFPGEREKCLGFGMNGYLAKPIDEGELYGLIKEMVSIRGGENRTGGPEKDTVNEDRTAYKYINLEYMRGISGGDKQYERTVTQLFIETTPNDLNTLESAFASKDFAKLRTTAHEMRTNVSVMGLSEKLQPFLDTLESEAFDETRFQQSILSIKTICTNALEDARHFYAML
jgi:CheY-like chemotaxis protein